MTDTSNFLFIVLLLAEGGELFDKIIEKTKLNETEAKLNFFKIPQPSLTCTSRIYIRGTLSVRA